MINKLLIFTLLTFFSIKNSHAQNWVWAQKIGNNKSDKVISIKTDTFGYIYASGYFSNQISLGTNNLVLNFVANANSKEAWIAKFDSTGVCLWARSGGAYFDDRVLGMDVDPNGNSVITGTYWEGAGIEWAGNFITAAGNGYGDQCFLVKHDANGNYVWGNWICSNSGDDQGLDIALDANGNSYVVGFMNGNILRVCGTTITVNTGNTNTYQQSYWLAKINSAGVPQWARCFGNLPYDTAHGKYAERDIAVCTDNLGGVYIGGGYDHSFMFGTTNLTSKGGYDVFAMKYDTSGNFHWAQGGGSRKDDWANGICADNKGFVYLVGEHRDSLLYDTLIVKNYDARDAFVLKLDANTGDGIWGSRAGSNFGGERANNVWADTACNVYVVGDIEAGSKFGDKITLPLGGSLQAFIAKINSDDGKWKWVASGGGPDSNDRCNAIAVGKGHQLYAGGFFRTPATYGNFGPFVSQGASDGFLARLNDSFMTVNCAPPPPPNDTLLGDIVGAPTPGDSIVDPLYVAPPLDSLEVYIPNAFSPDGNNYNDVFKPIWNKVDPSMIRDYSLIVMNRLGQQMFSTTNPSMGWQGNFKSGEQAAMDTYFYYIKFTTPLGKKKWRKGEFILVR